jgi:anti-sigma B factor antagonist
VQDGQILEIEQTVDPDGRIRLVLVGELDQASASRLSHKLEDLRASGEAIRLDLSRLEFIDSGGVRVILLSVRDARSDGRELEVDRQLSWQVKQVFDTLGLDAALWPTDDGTP